MIDDEIFKSFTQPFTTEQLPKIMASFIAEIPERVQNCLNAQADQSIEQLKSESHTLKSLAKTVGAVTLGEQAKEVEHACANDDFDLACSLITDLVKQSQNDVAQLKKMCGL